MWEICFLNHWISLPNSVICGISDPQTSKRIIHLSSPQSDKIIFSSWFQNIHSNYNSVQKKKTFLEITAFLMTYQRHKHIEYINIYFFTKNQYSPQPSGWNKIKNIDPSQKASLMKKTKERDLSYKRYPKTT